MAQSFISTYRNHYRWNDVERTRLTKPFDPFINFPASENEIINFDRGQSESFFKDGEDLDKLIHKLYRNRYWTTYQLHYCKDMIRKFKGEDEIKNAFENQLLEYCKNLYEPDSRPKVPAPLPGNRRMFGYIAPRRVYTPLTTYQVTIGKIPYDILMKNRNKLSPAENTAAQEQNIKANEVGNSVKSEKHQVTPEKSACKCVCCRNNE